MNVLIYDPEAPKLFTAQDLHFADQARGLMGTIRLASEEAKQYIEGVNNPVLRAQLEKEWEHL